MKYTGLRRNETTVSVMKHKYFSPALVSKATRKQKQTKAQAARVCAIPGYRFPCPLGLSALFVDTQFQAALFNE